MPPTFRPATDRAESALPPAERDAALVEAARRGDPSSVEELCARLGCVPRMVQGLNARMNSPLSAEDRRDLCQQVLELVWRKLGQFDAQASFESWVLGIVRYELLNVARRAWRRQSDGGEEELESAPARAPEQVVDREKISNALARIRPDDARVIRMHLFEERDFEEIALRLGISVSAAKNRYYRALQGLRVSLGGLAPRSTA